MNERKKKNGERVKKEEKYKLKRKRKIYIKQTKNER